MPVLWTVVAVATLNLLVGYLVAQALWPARIPALPQAWLVALALVGAVFLVFSVSGWIGYLRARHGR